MGTQHMTANEIRKQFLDYFASQQHKIVPSAPLVLKDDPTLLFTNSGMVQFKDYFLGNQKPPVPRIADTQKCLRVSGKHNDLEDVGKDGTHHTLFEMLGNWSFGDYFKEEAIAWSWDLLTRVYGLEPGRLYATVFGGDTAESLESDEEARQLWKRYLPDNHILYGNKKDNFWEMGEQGPCGPCSEIHIDLRSDEDRAALPGEELVNKDHPQVIEIWNNVFMQYERKADKSLVPLPAKHVDTGMGFERLCMVIQGKKFTYDTDVFTPLIQAIEKASGKTYTGVYAPEAYTDIAIRVVADHIRAVAFTIADGELPGNSGAGYVVRRILRRAVRYYYSFLGITEPFMHTLVAILAREMGDQFPEIRAQQEFVAKVILEEEKGFLRTLAAGIQRFEQLEVTQKVIDGQAAFELYDTFGFPIDLTRLMAAEKGWSVDEPGFDKALLEQKTRSRADATKEVGDWEELLAIDGVQFIGYDSLEVADARITRVRTVKVKGQDQYHLVLNTTPFYAEGGGQVGDQGTLETSGEILQVLDTRKENDLIIHYVDRLPRELRQPVRGTVTATRRRAVENNHTATHLVHAALREVLGTHVQQKGSLVNADQLRFDFSHFQKVTDEEITRIEQIVNERIRQDIPLLEDRSISIDQARASGAMMLFGEKYGDKVRMITFDPSYSRELCGGCHVPSTGRIGFFKIVTETAVAAGVRRIEALTAGAAEAYINEISNELQSVKTALKNPKDLLKQVLQLQEDNKRLQRDLEKLMIAQAGVLRKELTGKAEQLEGMKFLAAKVELSDAKALKTLAFELEQALGNSVIVLAAEVGEKPQLLVSVSKELTAKFHAGNLVRELAKNINGSGGGQPFFATAGGNDATGLDKALGQARKMMDN